jgi:predicted nucleic acid-binding protein
MKKDEVLTSALSLAEIAHWCNRNGKEASPYLQAMRQSSIILSVSDELAEKAGLNLAGFRQTSPGIGMVDAIIHATAESVSNLLLTGDPHFRNLPGVEFIE